MKRSPFTIRFLLALAVVAASCAASSVQADLVGYWRLDGDLTDSSGQGNDGELVGDPEFSDEVNEFSGGQSMNSSSVQ